MSGAARGTMKGAARTSAGGASRGSQGSDGCKRCGRERHALDKCPARSANCHKCNRKGHFSAQCFSKLPARADEVSLDSAFLGAVTSHNDSTWNASVKLNSEVVEFKLDTGAEVTVISDSTLKTLGPLPLQTPSKVLYGPTRQSLKVLGQFSGMLEHGTHRSTQTVFVVQDLKTNLLGLPAITALKLLQRVDATGTGEVDFKKLFPKLFEGLGTLGEEYQIRLMEGAKPYALYTPRHVAFPLREKVREELNRMEQAGVISKVDEPSEWCAGMVTVPKKSGDVRICVDLKPLNENVLREVHPMPNVDETLAKLAGAALFSKLDANSGFWQIPLAAESRPLTTFVTPFGRYHFNKLPFGISSAPELFQKRMSRVLEGLEGVVCQVDDVLVFGKDMAEHDARVIATLERMANAGMTLNSAKCEFRKKQVKFLGHLVDASGIRADPDKTAALQGIAQPKSITELRRFLGMANQLGKFSPRLAELSQPLRELLSKKRSWVWGPDQERAFTGIKTELSQPTVLALYDPDADVKVAADASSFGLGAVLLQRNGDGWRPVAYASRSMTDTEKRYAQIEKEALAVTWACDKFADFLLGSKFAIDTDHKPLVPLLCTKHLDNLPPRVLRFRLRLARFDYTVSHVPGKNLYTADTLSRAPLPDTADSSLESEAEIFISAVTSGLPATASRLAAYRQAQADDPVCRQVQQYCQEGWPEKCQVSPAIKPFWKERASLTLHDDLLLFNQRVVVPPALQRETLEKIHVGHLGIHRCRLRAKTSVWWPGVMTQVSQTVQGCATCAREVPMRSEPLKPTPLPDYPWQVLGSDLFQVRGTTYLLVVDYFSRYPEVVKMTSTTSEATITALKAVFSRHGIPEVLRTDNGPQYASLEFQEFSETYGFCHLTSSPRYPQSNGQAERAVRTVKLVLKKQLEEPSADPYLALLTYRATQLPWCGWSPAELLMGRRLRSSMPQTDDLLIPKWPYLPEFRQLNEKFKDRQKRDFDRRHRVQVQPELPDDSTVWVRSEEHSTPGRVVAPAPRPRSYVVETPSGEVQRNRKHLTARPTESPVPDTAATGREVRTSSEQCTSSEPPSARIQTRSQTGTRIRPPERL